MTLTHLCEIDFYIDGELGPEEACELEARLERDDRMRAVFDAIWRQKETLSRAMDAIDVASAASRQTARLQATLVQALSRRMAMTGGAEREGPALWPT
ncbi:hypothetical protein ROJ8625_00183 [Roseivivax jejudonensis]|uniref:Zinc-finger domain-containing protein n=1 Tax=Roseivivax jejudonensis TaxID=1529041 RepID=A0A1X6Y490_9RHOB|nr:hypothetical protein [Roseivivax jejudonensis]SLN10148.1 hypothetical protein ROJ8625_00183 [Roseivivax jejudonensis]